MTSSLLHPQVAPWCVPDTDGIDLCLLLNPDRLPDVTQVLLRCEPDNEETFVPLKRVGREGVHEVYSCRLGWDPGNDTTLYAFKVLAGGRQVWLAADGEHAFLPPRDVHFRAARNGSPPAWVADQVFYQIFPDRFAQGDPSHAVRSGEYVYDGREPVVAKPWGAPIDAACAASAFYGGDLPGICQRLDYLHDELGVTALYLNPVFTSGSNHKYDTEDYFNVDPHLGGNAALVALRTALDERGMRLVLDAVLNHTSDNHPWFNRWNRHAAPGAWQGAQPHASWYGRGADGQYVGWKGFAHLRVLDFAVPEVQQIMYAGQGSVLRHWMRPPYRIDGWRFDVIHMLGEGAGARNNAHHARAFRDAMKQENPDAYFLGEQFSEATRWLQGDQQDGAMNYYGFAHPVRAWLAGQDINLHPTRIDAAELDAWLTAARARIPYANQLAQFNLLGSHDTPRFRTLVGGNDDLHRLAVALLMTYPGTPCVYYGDETGVEGGPDPDNRRCFDWAREHWAPGVFGWHQALIRLRQSRAELRHGAFLTCHAQGDLMVFARFDARHASLVALNRGAADANIRPDIARLPRAYGSWALALAHQAQGQAAPAWNGEHLSLPAFSVSIWTADEPSLD